MDTTIYDKLSTTSTIVSFLPPLIGLVFLRNMRGYLVPVLILALCGLLTDGINYALMQNGVSNLPLFHFYTLLEFTLMSVMYFVFYKQYVKKNYLFLFMIPAFYIVGYVDYLLHGLNCIDSLSASIESVILTIYALISFLIIMNKLIFKDLLSAPFFWVNSAILLYFLGNLLIFAFCTYATESERVNTQAVWALHSILNIIFNLLICVAFWETRAK
ncbi:MAG: hypothetical protein JWP12_1326 [Bacteroidetes bacterium]|nr:hypothetical protein [Bacteroidota bacterium]